MLRIEVCPCRYFWWCRYFHGISVLNLFLTQWIIAILSKGCRPDNLEPQNSLKFSFTNFWSICSSFVECESSFEWNSLDILALWTQTWMTQAILSISLWRVTNWEKLIMNLLWKKVVFLVNVKGGDIGTVYICIYTFVLYVLVLLG